MWIVAFGEMCSRKIGPSVLAVIRGTWNERFSPPRSTSETTFILCSKPRAPFFCLPALPQKVSSTSTTPPPEPSKPPPSGFMASRMRCVMNHADLYVTPSMR